MDQQLLDEILQQEAATTRIGDLLTFQVHALATVLQVQDHHALSRGEVIQRLGAGNPPINDDSRLVRILAPAQIRVMASILGIDVTDDSREQIALKIRKQARQMVNQDNNDNNTGGTDAQVLGETLATQLAGVIPPTQADRSTLPAENPKDVEITDLTGTAVLAEIESWIRDIRSAGRIRQLGETVVELTERATTRARSEEIHREMNPRQTQSLDLIQKGMRKSMSKSLKITLEAEIAADMVQENIWSLTRFVYRQHEILGNSVAAEAKRKLDEAHWNASKDLTLAQWVSKIRNLAAANSEEIPAGFPRENRIRELIVKNVSKRDPSLAQIIREEILHRVDEPGHTVNDLVAKLSNAMAQSDKRVGEMQASVFAATFEDHEKKAKTFLAENQKLKKQLQEHEKKEKEGENEQEEMNFYGKGHSNWNYQYYGKSTGKGKRNGKWGSNKKNVGKGGEKFCSICSKFYADKAKGEKWSAIHSHSTKECRFYREDSRNTSGGKNDRHEKKAKKGKAGGKKGVKKEGKKKN